MRDDGDFVRHGHGGAVEVGVLGELQEKRDGRRVETELGPVQREVRVDDGVQEGRHGGCQLLAKEVAMFGVRGYVGRAGEFESLLVLFLGLDG